MSDVMFIGKKVPRDDARDKATGTLRYFSDYPQSNMLHGAVLRSPYPHARILKLDFSQALTMPNVVSVLTADDIPGLNGFGICNSDQPVLCSDKVRFCGDPVAVVLAEDAASAKAALGSVEVVYDRLQEIRTAKQALAPNAEKIHPNGNLCTNFDFTSGNVEEYFTDEYIVVENTYTTQYQEHAYLETEAGFAIPHADGAIEVFHPAQYGYRDRMQLGKILNLPLEKIIVHSTPLGGGFGGKDDMSLQPLLAVAAMKTGRPVRISIDREESFLYSTKRLPFHIHIKTSASRDGRLMANKVVAVCDCGPYTGISSAVLNYALENACGVYRFQAIDIKGDCVFTNNAHTGAFRGFGNNQLNFAVESQIDELSMRLGMDRHDLRRKNLIKSNETLNYGQNHGGCDGLHHAMDLMEKSKLWQNREAFKAAASAPHLKRGVGIAASQHGNGLGNALPNSGTAKIVLHSDGTFEVYVSLEEMGQGLLTSIHIIAAEALKTEYEKITVINGNTALAPDTGSTTASQATFVGGNAVLAAVSDLTNKASKALGGRDLQIQNEIILDGKPSSWQDVAFLLPEADLVGEGTFEVPIADVKIQIGLHYIHTHVCQVVGVEVNTQTGKVDILETEILPAAGTVINRIGYEGQAEGGVIMTMGYTLMEYYRLNEAGQPLTRNFQTYLIPTIRDMPDIKVTPVENPQSDGPYGAKGLGEPVTIPGTPAIVNAIYDAVGVRVYDLPATPEKVLSLLHD